jgi:hypothetical protein
MAKVECILLPKHYQRGILNTVFRKRAGDIYSLSARIL